MEENIKYLPAQKAHVLNLRRGAFNIQQITVIMYYSCAISQYKDFSNSEEDLKYGNVDLPIFITFLTIEFHS